MGVGDESWGYLLNADVPEHFGVFIQMEECKDQDLGRNEDPLNFGNDLRSCENGTYHVQL